MIALSPNALELLKTRYLRNTDETETPDELFKRVAKHLSSMEGKDQNIWYDRFYGVMHDLKFLPNSPTLMNAGLPNGQLSACFVLPIEDNLNSIFDSLKNAALIHHSGGGTGYNFSKLRPKDDTLISTGGTSAGPVAFMKLYDTATEHVKQVGKRRGANMGILNVDHPDIEAFITSKSDGRILQNFNISVGITDNFMKASATDSDWPLINPRTKKLQRTIKAKALWDLIVTEAQKTGDPGLIFFDAINKTNPLPQQGLLQSTNPCGEVPLLDYESCNLGSINLKKMINSKGDKTVLDWSKLEKTVNTAIRFLDNVISMNHYPLLQIKEKTLMNRKIGLGVMGWAELLMLLGVPYASEKAVSLAEKLMQFIQAKSYEASSVLARERGTFPSWGQSIFAPGRPMRNATHNSIAPTGSISVIADTSYAIEPLYALAYNRVGVMENKTQTEINEIFVNKMKQLDLWTEEVQNAVITTGSIQQVKTIPKNLKKVFQTSLEIPWKYHLFHQRAFQLFTDNAVSKTINLPGNTTTAEVSQIYRTAWKYGLKGITIYRNGSRNNQILQTCGSNTTEACN